jgi:hypothetical protein
MDLSTDATAVSRTKSCSQSTSSHMRWGWIFALRVISGTFSLKSTGGKHPNCQVSESWESRGQTRPVSQQLDWLAQQDYWTHPATNSVVSTNRPIPQSAGR